MKKIVNDYSVLDNDVHNNGADVIRSLHSGLNDEVGNLQGFSHERGHFQGVSQSGVNPNKINPIKPSLVTALATGRVSSGSRFSSLLSNAGAFALRAAILWIGAFLGAGILSLSSVQHAGAQEVQVVTLDKIESAEMKILGDSNLKKWDATITKMEIALDFKGDFSKSGELTAENFQGLRLQIPVEGIDSDSRGLTKNIHKYLNEKKYPVIQYDLKSVDAIEMDYRTEDAGAGAGSGAGAGAGSESVSGMLKTFGVITVSGVEHEVMMNVGVLMTDSSITFSGEQELRMTDFGIDPPTALMGTVRADDTIVVAYKVRLPWPAGVNTASL